MIVIVGQDREFTHTLAEQVVRELERPCECVSSLAELETAPLAQAELLVGASAFEHKTLPVLTLSPPLAMRDALAAIAARLSSGPQSVGGLLFSEREKTLTHASSGAQVSLTDKESQLFSALIEAGAAGVSKEALLRRVWGIEAALNTHTLETHIYRLRAKCKDLSGSETIDATDGGYRLAAL